MKNLGNSKCTWQLILLLSLLFKERGYLFYKTEFLEQGHSLADIGHEKHKHDPKKPGR